MKPLQPQRAAPAKYTQKKIVKGLPLVLQKIAHFQRLLTTTVSLEEFLAAREGLLHAYVELSSYSLRGTKVPPPQKSIAMLLAQLPSLDEQFLERYLEEYRRGLTARGAQEEEDHDIHSM